VLENKRGIVNLNDESELERMHSTNIHKDECDTIGSRIEHVRGDRSRSEYAAKLNIHPNTLKNYEQDKRPPDANTLNAIYDNDGVLSDWILRGKTPMLRTDSNPKLSTTDFLMVPRYEVEASAGGGSVVERESEIGRIAFRNDWIKQKGLVPKDLVVIRISGDSMQPTIKDGALVLVDTRREMPKSDGIYVIQNDGCLFAKRLQVNVVTGDLSIKSDNPIYDTVNVNASKAQDLYIIGRVVWAGQEV